MSVRRSRVTPLVGAGAAGLALAFAAAPSAVAHQAPQATSSPSGPAGSGAAKANPQPNDETTTVTETSSAPADPCAAVQPQYGYQKFRVGVQIKDGSVVPPDTDTIGSVVTITETGPCAPSQPTTEMRVSRADSGETNTCTTESLGAHERGFDVG